MPLTTFNLTSSRRAVPVVFASLVAAGSVAAITSFDRATASDSDEVARMMVSKSSALEQAEPLVAKDLSGQLVVQVDHMDPAYTAATVEAAAKELSQEVPFPPGLNSMSHRNWSALVDRGVGAPTITRIDLLRAIQANALRDWAWYAAHNELDEHQRTVVGAIPNWSAFRAGSKLVQRVVGTVLAGPSDEAKVEAAGMFRGEGGSPRPSRW